MPAFDLQRRIFTEALGTCLLVATVVGSGIMADTLTDDVALALLGNTLATGAILVVLITIFGPISGAHFNPAVSLVFALKRELPRRDLALYIVAQCLGGIAGTIVAHLMFDLAPVEASLRVRTGPAQWFSEGVAGFWPGGNNPCRHPLRAAGRAMAGRALYHRGLLVHRLHLLRQPRRGAGAVSDQYLLRDPSGRSPGFRHRGNPGSSSCTCPDELVATLPLLRSPCIKGLDLTVTIYHNPDCGTSRNTLAMIRNAGIEPIVIEYLRITPSRDGLKALIADAGLGAREAIREKGTPFDELGLADPALSDDALLDAMLAHPILINRPFVVTPMGTRLCRPSEVVLDILPETHKGPFAKEDGEQVLDAEGKRLV